MMVNKEVEQQREVEQDQTSIHTVEGETYGLGKTAQAASSPHPPEEPKTECKTRPTTTSHTTKEQKSSENIMDIPKSTDDSPQGKDTSQRVVTAQSRSG